MEATAWIALVALGFTGTQAWVAHRKLRFDLYDKRFDTWSAFNDAINECRQEIESTKNLSSNISYVENLKKYGTLRDQ
ncbi:hypothetical protein ACFQWF_00115 [Methylorubrum suomiense]